VRDNPQHEPGLSLEEAIARLTLLTEVSTALSSTLDADAAAERLGRLLVPQLADWCAVDLLDQGSVRRATVVHRDPNQALPAGPSGPVGPAERPTPPAEGGGSLSRVLRGVGPLLLDAAEAAAPADEDPLQDAQREVYDLLGADTVVLAPLAVRRQVLGALTLVRTGAGQPLTEDDMTLVGEIAHRAALAIDNARLYTEQQQVAERLQRSLLPPLPQVDYLSLSARYVAARESAEVGGDWYDAFVLPDGMAGLVIGDVMGHDLAAAVSMSQVRNMLRALAWDRQEPPGEIMRRLDQAMSGVGHAAMVTAIFARVEGPEGGPWQLHWSNAGHPPPLLVTQDGDTRYLEAGHGPLLGIAPAEARTTASEVLPAQSTLLLYTDGLVERRGEHIDRGLTRLRRQAAALAQAPVQQFCDDLCDSLVDTTGATDDIALLALRLPASTGTGPGFAQR
jgi:sigma-B regulation protein RsbU (phosphoserine phosphatase)